MNIQKTEIKFYKITCVKLIMILSVTLSAKHASTQPPSGGADLQETTSLSNSFEDSDIKPFCFTKGELSDLANYKLDCDLIKNNLYTTKKELNDCYKESFGPSIGFWGYTVTFGLGVALGAFLVFD